MMQVLRNALVWASLLTAAVVGRDVLDWWLAPTTEFYARSIVSTGVAAAIFAASGLWSAVRSRSVPSGMLAVRHDPHTMAMIRASGGVSEIFLLPYLVLVPGTLCAAVSAGFGRLLVWSAWSRPAQ